jgi:hypothetical protein
MKQTYNNLIVSNGGVSETHKFLVVSGSIEFINIGFEFIVIENFFV